jgi:hypothetical protein
MTPERYEQHRTLLGRLGLMFWLAFCAALVYFGLGGVGRAEARDLYLSHRQAEKQVLAVNYRLDYVTCIGYGRESREGSGRFRRFSCVAGKRACTYTFNLHSTTHGLTYRAFDVSCSTTEPEVTQ